MILTRLRKISLKILFAIPIIAIVMQIPMINTFVTQGLINLCLPRGMSIHISRLEGVFPFNLKTAKIKLKDETSKDAKVWLLLENFHFSWRAVDFLYGNFHIESLSADSVTLYSLPIHLFTFDDDPIYLPYINIDYCEVQSLKVPLLFSGDMVAKANLTSDFQDNHDLDLRFYNSENKDLPALIKLHYIQNETNYSLHGTSQQGIHSFHSLSPSVIDHISKGDVNLSLQLAGKSDFLELGGSLEASLTNLQSTLPALQSLVGSSASTTLCVYTQKSADTKQIIIKDGILKTDKGLQVTLDYQRTQHPNGKDHHLKTQIKIPDSTEFLTKFVRGPLNVSAEYDYRNAGTHKGYVIIQDPIVANFPLKTTTINFTSTPQTIDFSGTGGLRDLMDAEIRGAFKKEGTIFKGPLTFSAKSSTTQFIMEGELTHGAPLPWNKPVNTIPPVLVLHKLQMDHNNKSIMSLMNDILIQGNPSSFYDTITIPKAHLTFLDGTLIATDLRISDTPTGEVILNNVSAQAVINTFNYFNSDNDSLKNKEIKGKLNGNLKFKGESENHSPYDLTLLLKDFGIHNELQKSTPLISLDFKAEHSGKTLNWIGNLLNTKDTSLKWQGKSETTYLIPQTGDPIQYSLTGLLDISALKSFIPNSDKYNGKIDVHLKGNGPLSANPFANLSGTIGINNGSYENARFGTLIKDISINGVVKGNSLSLNKMTARDLAKGSIGGEGTVDFQNIFYPRLTLNLTLDRFLLTNTDESTILSSGKITILPHGPTAPHTVSGKISVDGAVITLENASAEPKTIRLYRDEKELEEKLERFHDNSTKDFTTQLDLDVEIPDKLFINGFGLKSEWSGKLNLKGPANCPEIQGNIHSLSGRLNIANKHLSLEKSTITFTKSHNERGMSEIIPHLNIKTSKNVGEYTAYLIISGSAFDPILTFRSEPALSKEAVISLILFDKTMPDMTPAQTLQLATALANLNSKSFTGSAFNTLTNILGVDELSIAESDSKEKGDDTSDELGGGYSLRVGKQLNDRIYLGIDQGIRETNETKAHLKIDVTKNTKVDIETGTEDSAIGYNWEMRY